ncbi:MAG: YicC family protein, partial [Clostridia bacterium]|nr:YicC family protein [Clostridia bacterium]
SYCNALKELAGRLELNLRDDNIMSSLTRYNDIFVVHKNEADEEKIWNAVKVVVDEAVTKFIDMREQEGNKLKNDVLNRADTILEKVTEIEERSPETVKEYNDRLLARINEFLSDVQVDEQRILTECAIFADKVAVAEETVRLRSHIDQLRQFLCSDEAVGRKIDFLVQEMNREANTIGSKAQDVTIARNVIDIKAEIEKIREQIQNIE